MQLWLQYRIAELRNTEDGAAAVEYGLLVGLIAIAIIAAVIVLGEELNEMFEYVGTELSDIPAAPVAT
ncbi:MAG: Flp family type IVb pilin [Actinomycetota bacterium]